MVHFVGEESVPGAGGQATNDLLRELIDEVKGLRADLAKGDESEEPDDPSAAKDSRAFETFQDPPQPQD